MSFKLEAPFAPAGGQVGAVRSLCRGIRQGLGNQVLLGVTGSGKTFSMACVIARLQRPALILAHNKTLAAQLFAEMRGFFPHNHVEYFVSYYDYYQPEAYVPRTDTYIEKDAKINDYIDRLRHSATRHLLEHRDTIVVASVSSIYGIGDVDEYSSMVLRLEVGGMQSLMDVTRQLVELQYVRNDVKFDRGNFRVRGDSLEIFPSHLEDAAWRISFFDDSVEHMVEFDVLTGEITNPLSMVYVYPNKHFVVQKPAMRRAIESIKKELNQRLRELREGNRLVEAQRLEERTLHDLEMLVSTGFCTGIENYSRHLTGREEGTPPPTLFDYIADDMLLFVDESHVTVPQIGGMYRGDFARKTTLVNYGFRLPSAVDNRPLKFEEWEKRRPQTVYVSATPGPYELEKTEGVVVEQIIRPTGLLDPPCIRRPVSHQVDDLMAECVEAVKKKERVLVTTLTKKMAEDLTEHLREHDLKARYLHSDVETLNRVKIVRDLRRGDFDILVGINLLREGLDIPECALVAVLDADKEGFLRSKQALIQTIGRAARHIHGRVILYADTLTPSLQAALEETKRRRKIQESYNRKHGITPTGVRSSGVYRALLDEESVVAAKGVPADMELSIYLAKLDVAMRKYAQVLDFEKAAKLRDERKKLVKYDLALPVGTLPCNPRAWALARQILEKDIT